VEENGRTSASGGGLDHGQIEAIADRLREVRRRWSEESAGEEGAQATEVLDAVLADLETPPKMGNGVVSAEDVDLGLAMVEEIFAAGGNRGFVQVIAAIRSSLTDSGEDAGEEEPPPPVRFRPPPTAAVRRRRPRPPSHNAPPPPKPKTRGAGRLLLATVVIAAAAMGGFWVLRDKIPADASAGSEDARFDGGELISTMPSLAPPPPDPRPPWSQDDFDEHADEMAAFTLEIRLVEEAVAERNLNQALKHFAAAAAIDRSHPRVLVTGKYLIACMLREGDLADAAGDELQARKRIRSAYDLCRGLGFDVDPPEGPRSGPAFEDLDLGDPAALRQTVGRPARLELKTGDLLYGRVVELGSDHLVLDLYAGTRESRAEKSKQILVPTIRQIRAY